MDTLFKAFVRQLIDDIHILKEQNIDEFPIDFRLYSHYYRYVKHLSSRLVNYLSHLYLFQHLLFLQCPHSYLYFDGIFRSISHKKRYIDTLSNHQVLF